MKGYMSIAPQVFADESALLAWLERAATFTRTLPAKK